MDYWYAFKNHYKKNNNTIVCIKPSWIKTSNNKHSSELSSEDKIEVIKGTSFKCNGEEGLYYIVEGPVKKNTTELFIKAIENETLPNTSNNTSQKKKIAILFSGQMRTNPLGLNKKTNQQILNSINKYLMNHQITSNYEVDVFISTDNANISECLKFFNSKVKNIHCFDNHYYLHPYKQNKVSWAQCHKNYMTRDASEKKYRLYADNFLQFYRLYDCFNMMEEYESKHGYYDYIIRSRLDVVYRKNIFQHIVELDKNQNTIYFGACDLFSLGKKSIMEYFCNGAVNKLGSYIVKCPDEIRWRYAPEAQVHACLDDYCKKNNKNFSNSIKNVGIPTLQDFLIICR